MLELLKNLVANQQFIPLSNSYLWQSNLLLLHLLPESIIAIANYTIGLTLLYFVRLRQDLPYNWVFLLLAASIVVCGIADLLDIWTLWYPTYGLNRCIKSVAAFGLLYAAFELLKIIPKIVAVSTPEQLETANNITNGQISEADLKASEARFQEIAHTISQLFLVRSATTGEVIYVSPAYERIWGRSCESLYRDPQSWVEAIHPDDRPLVTQSLTKQFAGNSVIREYRIVRPNGEIRWIFAQITILRDESDKPLRFIGFADDISDRKFAEQALQEKENFLRSIYDGVGQPILVVDVALDDFRFIGLNPAYEQATGLRSQDIQGKTPEQIFSPAAAAIAKQHYQDCLAAGETITYEECLTFKAQETWWITSLTPLKKENSCIYRLVASSINITQQKHTQKMLELQAVITRNMAEGICLVRASDGIFVYTNPKFEQMFGYGEGELIGQQMSMINYADENTTFQTFYQAIEAAVLQHGVANYEVCNVKKDGTPFWCQANISVFEHPEYGTVFVAVQQDISEQKQAQEQIKASLKEKEVLLQEIHHRVKNNLGIVTSLLQMQCRRTKDPQATAILLDSQNRIASIALVHEKLYRSANLSNINFAEYIVNLTSHLFDSYNINSNLVKLNIQVDDVSLNIETIIPCALIINELVSNALKYAFPKSREGEIEIILEQQDSNLILIIRDNGVGLTPDFDSKKDKTLGLTLVYGLVKQLKGKIEITSQSGVEFKINFTKIKA